MSRSPILKEHFMKLSHIVPNISLIHPSGNDQINFKNYEYSNQTDFFLFWIIVKMLIIFLMYLSVEVYSRYYSASTINICLSYQHLHK